MEPSEATPDSGETSGDTGPMSSGFARRLLRRCGELDDTSRLTLPKRFGKYELLEVLDRGGMGVVFRAREEHLQRDVALKLIRWGRLASSEERRRFELEARAVARLDHPGIVKIYEASELDGTPYLTMQLLRGGSLFDRADEFVGQPRRVAALIEELARAVHHAHERGVLHRDIKPANILFDDDGRPHLSDFGLARFLDSTSRHTAAGAMVGTLAYAAPEQIDGDSRALTPMVDIYGLGTVLYELIAGEAPFRAQRSSDLLRQILENEPVPPSRIYPGVPRDLETICLECLEKDPRRRYQSAGALADDIARFRGGRSIRARPAGPIRRLARWAGRRPAAAGLVALVLAVLLGVPPISLWYSAELVERTDMAMRLLYATRVNSASFAHEHGDSRRARTLLASVVPGPEQRDILGFAWSHLTMASSPEYRSFNVGGDRISAIAFIDDQRLAVVGGNGTLRRFIEIADGRILHEQRVEHGRPYAVISPDGRFLLQSRAPSGRRGPREVTIAALTDGPDGPAWTAERVIAPGADGRTDRVEWLVAGEADGVTLRDVQSGELVARAAECVKPIWRACVAPDASRVVVAENGGDLHLFDRVGDRLELVRRVPLGTSGAYPCLTGRGDRLAFVGAGKLELWTTNPWRRQASVSVHRTARVLAIDETSGRLVLASSAEAQIWDWETRSISRVLRSHTADVVHAVFDPTGRYLATGDEVGDVKVWDLSDPGTPFRIHRESRTYDTVCLPAPGRCLAARRTFEIDRFALESHPNGSLSLEPRGTITFDLEGSSDTVLATDDNLAAVAYEDGRIDLHRIEWDDGTGHREAGPPEATLTVAPTSVTEVRFTPGARGFVAGCGDFVVRLWRRITEAGESSWRFVHSFPVRPDSTEHAIRDIVVSPDERLVAIIFHRQPQVHLHDLKTGRRISLLKGHGDWVIALAFDPESRRLATGGLDREIRVWDVTDPPPSPRPLLVLRGHSNAVAAVTFLPGKETVLASGSDDRKVKIWDLVVGEERATLFKHQGHVNALARAPDTSFLISAGGEQWDMGELVVWQARRTEPGGRDR